MKLREKLEKLMIAISFAEANCPKEAKFFLQESKKQNNLRPEKKVCSRPTSRPRC